MFKKKLVFLVIFLLFLIGIIIILLRPPKKINEVPPQPTVRITPVTTPITTNPRIIAIEPMPMNSTVDVSPAGEISFSFSQPVETESLIVEANPPLKINKRFDSTSTKLTIWPAINWDMAHQKILIRGGGLLEPSTLEVKVSITSPGL